MARNGRTTSRVDTIIVVVCAALALLVRVLPEPARGPIASGIRQSVIAPLISLQRSAELTRNALQSHEERTITIDSLALEAMDSRALAAENETLRRLVGLGARLRTGFVPAEALYNAGGTNEHTLTLTAGARAGIRPRSAVVSPDGLVGMVHTVDPTMSIAIVWTHPDFRVSAMDAAGSAFGIVQAHRGDGAERYLLEMRGVPFRGELAVGTEIISTGIGPIFPKGIPIGVVVSEIETPEGWTRTYLLRPAVRPPDVRTVIVLEPTRASAGVDGVWGREAGRDSAVRSIVRGADSLARESALAEAAARRAAQAAAPRDTAEPPVAARAPAPPPPPAETPAVRREPPPAVRAAVDTPAGRTQTDTAPRRAATDTVPRAAAAAARSDTARSDTLRPPPPAAPAAPADTLTPAPPGDPTPQPPA